MVGKMTAFVATKMVYDFHVPVAKDMGPIRTTMKFPSQFAPVEIAFAGPRILGSTIST